MQDTDILIVGGPDIEALLTGREQDILQIVSLAYQVHGRGESSLPHSLFLRFPHNPKNRIIALPAYLGEDMQVSGIKWIASFPDNLEKGLDRASAVMIMNSTETGRPEAILEGSLISAKRTAASAALAAHQLHQGLPLTSIGLVGCGVINMEIARFLLAVFPDQKRFTLFDSMEGRAQQFKAKCQGLAEDLDIDIAPSIEALLRDCRVVSLATTAATPHIDDLSMCAEGTTILHVSLRDISAEAILTYDNVVDDVDHVTRAQTSVHLAEQQVGHRQFMRATLAEVITGQAPARQADKPIVIFSPFGLGVLDIAVGKLVCHLASKAGKGIVVPAFLPNSWSRQ